MVIHLLMTVCIIVTKFPEQKCPACRRSLVQFHPDTNRLQLFSSSLDCGIRLWDLRTSECVCVLQSHYSAVTSLAFSPDGSTMIRSSCCLPTRISRQL